MNNYNSISNLQIGKTYSNDEIKEIFKCSPQGGMRKSNTTKTLVIFSDHTKSIYDDIWYDDTLIYTGMGKKGDQVLKGNQNITLYESETNGIKVHLFETFVSTKHIYKGLVKLSGTPFIGEQEDVDGINRKVWLFPLKLINNIPIEKNLLEYNKTLKSKKARKMTQLELKDKIKNKTKPSTRTVISKTYVRDELVSQYAKNRANGICDLCGSNAPFNDSHGNPYLECHHIKWLSDGGEDSLYNTVALCPNCHKKMHICNLDEDIHKLLNKIKNYER